MTDQELLELVALEVGYSNPTGDDDIWLHDETGELHQWNPLADDADAFALLVECGIDLFFYGDQHVQASARYCDEVSGFVLGTDGDERAAVRRVIVMTVADLQRRSQ